MGVIPFLFGFGFVVFAIRYLFPEIRDEVPGNSSKGLNFLKLRWPRRS